MKTETFTTTLAGKPLTAEFSDLTEQADGSVLLRCGETVVLTTVVLSDQPTSASYFPLSVEFEEKFYAAGAILGNRFQRREGRPSDEAILSARIVDRTIRPLFDHRLRHEVQVVVTVLAIGEEDPDVLGVIGASLALGVSPIPWSGPVGAVRIGRQARSGALVVNPTYRERADDQLDLEVFACGGGGAINMLEMNAHEVPEATVQAALETASDVHDALVRFQHDIIEAIGAPKQTMPLPEVPDGVVTFFREHYADTLQSTLFSGTPGTKHLTALEDVFTHSVAERALGTKDDARAHFATALDEMLHRGAVQDGVRADGRAADEIRLLYAQAGGISPVLHGSGIFYRGGTHIFSALTLGSPGDAQAIDTVEAQDEHKHFLHHYNFPPFSVGETGRVGGFNRRMIGHGALAEKALAPVIPALMDFPYTIRLVSETMASNGSSSMGSVCAGSLALMDGGVPITRPVAGIALGVMFHNGSHTLLTDIQGPEDEHGDMDCKVAGTTVGVTAIQMDVKVTGIPLPVLVDTLEAAQVARRTILLTMEQAIAAPRQTVSPRAPHIVRLAIEPEQIGLVIGSGGKTVNGIKDMSDVDDIRIEEDGTIYVCGRAEAVATAVERIKHLTHEYELGSQYQATVTSITDYGAFARFDDGRAEGLIHISEIAPHRVASVATVLQVGDVVPTVILKNEHGKIALSIAQADPAFFTTKRRNRT